MTLRDMMKRHAAEVWVRPDHHGESCTYHPQDGAGPYVFDVVVDRLGLEDVARYEGAGLARVATIFIPASSDTTKGLEDVAKGDDVELELERPGGTVVRCRVLEVLEADAAGFLVRVGK